VHDAFLISAPSHRIDEDTAAMREIMAKAGRAVTGGFDVRTDAKIARWPDRYMDKRGEAMWSKVVGLMGLPDGPGSLARDTALSQSVRHGPELETVRSGVPNAGRYPGLLA
jgi:hypothetical protein